MTCRGIPDLSASRLPRWRFAALVAALLIAPPPGEAMERTRVYAVVVDGLDARMVNATATPHLWALIHDGQERATFYPVGRPAMLAVTNTNHTSIATGVWAAGPDK